MSQSIDTGYAVIVLGDQDTARRADLAEKAADQGAVIAETYSFECGQAVSHEDLTEVEVAITAMARAIETGTDIWVPFPLHDLGREAHVRRVALVLQRHGLRLLIGRDLEPSDGGFNEIDFALRAEVRAVDDIDNAVIAVAGVTTLGAAIEQALTQARTPAAPTAAPGGAPVAAPVAAPAGERFYGTGEVARFLGQSVRWLTWALREGVFVRPDGSLIEPIRVGRNRRRRFSVPVLRDMTLSCYRRGILSEDQMLDLLSVLAGDDGD